MSRFLNAVREVSRTPRDVWKPVIMPAGDPVSRAKITDLLEAGRALFVHDEIMAQLGGLLETRLAHHKFSSRELEDAAREYLGGMDPADYGVWVHYPWSRRLVHLLPEAEFRELRTSRNRNKITTEEQARLRTLRLGISGLSVGRATAATLALEEIGGCFRLADFDHLELSNLNRLRCGVHDLGINKAVLTARELFEINPFLDVQIFTEGVTDSNIDDFMLGIAENEPLDLLFEECDDLAVKVRLRERARELRIPVLMETSDRGMLDIERYDLEPDRPPFHGLAGELDTRELSGLTTYEKVPIVLKILGEKHLSPRMAASLIDIDSTLKTWPQLASAVALGGALNADAARRIALGQLQGSGRFYVDPESIVQDGQGLPTPAGFRNNARRFARRPVAPLGPVGPLAPARTPLSRGDVEALVARAAMAPSGGNCQPWRFSWDGTQLSCFHDLDRSRTLLDFRHQATHLAFGAVVENLTRAARGMGLVARTELFPESGDPLLVASIEFSNAAPPTPAEREEGAEISKRVTNRRLSARSALTGDERKRLHAAAQRRGGRLRLITDPVQLDAIASVLAAGDRVRFLCERLHRELFDELRWTPTDASSTCDGIDIRSLELDATDHAGLSLTSDWKVMSTVARLGGGHGLERLSKKSIDAAAAVGLVSYEGGDSSTYVEGGRAVQSVWLEATALGLAFQPMSALVYLFHRNEEGDGEGFSQQEREHLRALRERFDQIFPPTDGCSEMLVFRLGRAGPPSARALRRGLDQILELHPSPTD